MRRAFLPAAILILVLVALPYGAGAQSQGAPVVTVTNQYIVNRYDHLQHGHNRPRVPVAEPTGEHLQRADPDAALYPHLAPPTGLDLQPEFGQRDDLQENLHRLQSR